MRIGGTYAVSLYATLATAAIASVGGALVDIAIILTIIDVTITTMLPGSHNNGKDQYILPYSEIAIILSTHLGITIPE